MHKPSKYTRTRAHNEIPLPLPPLMRPKKPQETESQTKKARRAHRQEYMRDDGEGERGDTKEDRERASERERVSRSMSDDDNH